MLYSCRCRTHDAKENEPIVNSIYNPASSHRLRPPVEANFAEGIVGLTPVGDN